MERDHSRTANRAKDVDLATKLTVYLVDGMSAVFFVVGIGFMLAVASVNFISAKPAGH